LKNEEEKEIFYTYLFFLGGLQFLSFKRNWRSTKIENEEEIFYTYLFFLGNWRSTKIENEKEKEIFTHIFFFWAVCNFCLLTAQYYRFYLFFPILQLYKKNIPVI